MTIYSTIIIILLFLFVLEQTVVSNKTDKKLFFIASFLVLFVMSFRGVNVGGDMIEYVHFWQGRVDSYGTYKNPNILLSYEPGLSWLCYFFHLFNNGESWFFVMWSSALTLLPFLYIIWRDAKYKVMPILLYLTLWGLLDISYTAIRQVIGISLCLIAYIIWTSILNKRIKIVSIVLLLAFAITFHTSVYFAIPVYIFFFYLKTPSKKTLILLLISSLLLGMFFSEFAPSLFARVESLFTSQELLFRYDHYFVKEGLTTSRIGFQQIITTFLICMILLVYKEDRKSSFYAFNFAIGCSLLNLFISFPNAVRFLYPLLFIGVITIPETKSMMKYDTIKYIIIILVIVLSVHRIYKWEEGFNDQSSEYYKYSQMFPYKFIWE